MKPEILQNLLKRFVDTQDDSLYRIESRITRKTFKTGDGTTGFKSLLGENPHRVGFVLYNESSSIILISFDAEETKPSRYTTAIGASTEYPYAPDRNPYQGMVTFNPQTAADGAIQVTEFVRIKNRMRGDLK